MSGSIIRKRYSLIIALVFWLLMMGGFSDNWLTDIRQETNYMPKFIIHGLLAFCWYSFLVLQTVLVKYNNLKLHMRLGVLGMVLFYSMVVSVIYLHLFPYESDDAQVIMINSAKVQSILGVVLVTLGYMNRLKDKKKHLSYILFGTFCLMQPSIDRFTGKFFAEWNIFGLSDMVPWLLIYMVVFMSFVWYMKKLTWYMIAWFIIWLYFLFKLIMYYN